ncbi:hypothetical protein B0H15DRAFT_1001280 [Mycena belliarum]|uniref:NAD(P)-binding domain-containing protein n=1 Tax=Mycena belliarum TaxID=1033014 RepID=A0AAD6TY54_9AGAR|nr:hypothetical protein B0H15DRAFT_1001280 [Mycena belliae]
MFENGRVLDIFPIYNSCNLSQTRVSVRSSREIPNLGSTARWPGIAEAGRETAFPTSALNDKKNVASLINLALGPFAQEFSPAVMRLLIFGATGLMGVLLAREYLAVYPACTLILYLRTPSKLPPDIAANPLVIPIQGELDETHNIARAMEGVDAVVAALGPTSRKGPLYPPDTPIAAAYARILGAMRAHGVRRLIALTTPAARDPADRFALLPALQRAACAAFAPDVARDVRAVAAVVRAQEDIDWTLVRVAGSGAARGRRAVVAGYVGDGKTGAVAGREGAAAFIIRELEGRQWVRKAPVLSTR